METEILPFNRHAELLGPDLLIPIKILLNIRLLLVKKKSLKEIFSTWKNYWHCQLRHIFVCCYKRLLSCYYSFQEIHLNNGEAVVCQDHVEKHTTSHRTETDGRNARWKTSIFYDADPGLEFLWWMTPRPLEQLWACVLQEKPFGTLQKTMELRTELETFKSWCASLQREDQPCVMPLITLNPFHPMSKGSHCYRSGRPLAA